LRNAEIRLIDTETGNGKAFYLLIRAGISGQVFTEAYTFFEYVNSFVELFNSVIFIAYFQHFIIYSIGEKQNLFINIRSRVEGA
jgi:hypothetical protein